MSEKDNLFAGRPLREFGHGASRAAYEWTEDARMGDRMVESGLAVAFFNANAETPEGVAVAFDPNKQGSKLFFQLGRIITQEWPECALAFLSGSQTAAQEKVGAVVEKMSAAGVDPVVLGVDLEELRAVYLVLRRTRSHANLARMNPAFDQFEGLIP